MRHGAKGHFLPTLLAVLTIGMGGAVGVVQEPTPPTKEVAPAIAKANEINDRSVVVEFVTDARENVFPMVPAGATNSEVVVDPSQQHLLDGRD